MKDFLTGVLHVTLASCVAVPIALLVAWLLFG